MILTNDEIRQVRQAIEVQAGLDEELMRRCGHLIHLGAFDEAVRSAFVLLEERLRKIVKDQGMTGTQLANYAFDPQDGPLAKHLGNAPSEREGLHELYSGAFKLFRNPTAHGVVGYGPAEGKAIIGLVDLMLKLLKRAEQMVATGAFTANVEQALDGIEQVLGPGATGRLRAFLSRCVRELPLKPAAGKQWIPFKRYALYQLEHWQESRPHPIAVFYLVVTEPALHFSTSYYYTNVIGFNVDRLIEELTGLGFYLVGKDQEPHIDLRTHNDQPFFDALFDLVVRTADELEVTLRQE